MSNMCVWLREKWKIALGSILALLAVLSVYLRSKKQKEVLRKANESHEKDNKINEDALRKVSEGLDEIHSSTLEELEASRLDHEKIQKDLREEKEEFEKDASKSDNLAEDLAEQLGAKYVKKD